MLAFQFAFSTSSNYLGDSWRLEIGLARQVASVEYANRVNEVIKYKLNAIIYVLVGCESPHQEHQGMPRT